MDLDHQRFRIRHLLRRADRARLRSEHFLVYLMIVMQGFIGYGTTSVLAAVVVEISRAGTTADLRHIMLAGLAGGAAARGSPACCTTGTATISAPSRWRSPSACLAT